MQLWENGEWLDMKLAGTNKDGVKPEHSLVTAWSGSKQSGTVAQIRQSEYVEQLRNVVNNKRKI